MDPAQAEPKCVTLMAKDDNGFYWPTDDKWSDNKGKMYGMKELESRYVTVDDCLPKDTKESDMNARGKALRLTREGQ